MRTLEEMAKTRELWIDQLVDNLCGAYAEYCFVELENLNKTNKFLDAKQKEYKRLIRFNVLRIYFSKTKQKFDKEKALNEALDEVRDFHRLRIEKYAKNEYDDYYNVKSKLTIDGKTWENFCSLIYSSIKNLDESVNVWGIPFDKE